MADITAQSTVVYEDGKCSKTALLALKNVTAADTIDVAPWFRVIKRAGIVSATGTTIAAATVNGTVITMPAGPANDALWLLIVGVAV